MTDDVLKTVAERIRQAREEAGLTQEHLGATLGVSPDAIANWEKLRRKAGLDDLVDIARITGKPLPWFFGEMPGEMLGQKLTEVIRRTVGDFLPYVQVPIVVNFRTGENAGHVAVPRELGATFAVRVPANSAVAARHGLNEGDVVGCRPIGSESPAQETLVVSEGLEGDPVLADHVGPFQRLRGVVVLGMKYFR